MEMAARVLNGTEIKTRHGLILQGTIREALRHAGFGFRENWQYCTDCERPDFTIPDTDAPQFAVEVHQTDARDSFRMKILRSLNAVTEAKVFFGIDVISVNILFGDPENELPNSNVDALCGFFDTNLVPRRDAEDQQAVINLEEDALRLAQDPDIDVAEATQQVVDSNMAGICALAALLGRALSNPTENVALEPLWAAETERVNFLGPAPSGGAVTHYKRAILESLFLSDDHFNELREIRNPDMCSEGLRSQLVLTGLAENRPCIRGDCLVLVPTLAQFIADPDAPRMRSLCEQRLDAEQSMHWFFEDIRNSNRRQSMVCAFIERANLGEEHMRCAVTECVLQNEYAGIDHTRCWLADLMPLVVDESHNDFNRRMFQHPNYRRTLGNPFNNITIRSPRLGSDVEILTEYADLAVTCFYEACEEHNIVVADICPEHLSSRLMVFRVDAAVKLQRLNPLYLEIVEVADQLGLRVAYEGVRSLLSDLSGERSAVGVNDLFIVTDGDREVLANALYVGESYGSDHKADEWSARRRSLGYRIENGEIVPVQRAGYILVLDGVWLEKSVRKLHTAGWDHICRLPDLESVLRELFGL